MSQKQTVYRIDKYRDPMDDILDRPIAYQPSFKTITGSTVAAIFLTQAWYWSKRHADNDGWFYKSGIEWEEETRLSRSEQETARKHCKNAGVLEEKLKGVPATMYYRVIKEKVYELLGVEFAGKSQTEFAETPQTSSQDVPEFAGKQQSDNPANINESMTPPVIPSGIPKDTPSSFSIPGAGPDWQIGHGQKVTEISGDVDFRLKAIDQANLIATGAPILYAFAFEFCMATHLLPTDKQITGWRKSMMEWTKYQPHPAKPEQIKIAVKEYENLTITGPWSLTNLQGIAGKNGNSNGAKPKPDEDLEAKRIRVKERIKKAREQMEATQ